MQAVASQFYGQLETMLQAAQADGRYPINAAAEIRCNTVDGVAGLPWADVAPPTLAATHSVDPGDPALDTVIWLNVGTIPGHARRQRVLHRAGGLDPRHLGQGPAQPAPP